LRPAATGYRVRPVGSHESIVDDIVAGVDLLVGFALILIPDAAALPREDRTDREETAHLARLEYATLWVNQRNTLAAELEAGEKTGRIEKAAISSGNAVYVIEGNLLQLSIAWRRKHRRQPREPLPREP
jgi:hypothetical protein